MDEVHAWDQPDLHFYVFAGADLYDHPVDLFQTTLGGRRTTRGGISWHCGGSRGVAAAGWQRGRMAGQHSGNARVVDTAVCGIIAGWKGIG